MKAIRRWLAQVLHTITSNCSKFLVLQLNKEERREEGGEEGREVVRGERYTATSATVAV